MDSLIGSKTLASSKSLDNNELNQFIKRTFSKKDESSKESLKISNNELSKFRRMDNGISFYGNQISSTKKYELIRQNALDNKNSSEFKRNLRYLTSQAAVKVFSDASKSDGKLETFLTKSFNEAKDLEKYIKQNGIDIQLKNINPFSEENQYSLNLSI